MSFIIRFDYLYLTTQMMFPVPLAKMITYFLSVVTPTFISQSVDGINGVTETIVPLIGELCCP